MEKLLFCVLSFVLYSVNANVCDELVETIREELMAAYDQVKNDTCEEETGSAYCNYVAMELNEKQLETIYQMDVEHTLFLYQSICYNNNITGKA
jgi:hypothetical protein